MDINSNYMRKAAIMWSILLVVSLLLGYSIFNAFSSRIYANVYESMSNNLKFAESSYSVFMSQMKMGLLQASVDPGFKELIVKRDEPALRKLLIEWGDHRPYVSEWYVAGSDGSIICSTGNGSAASAELNPRAGLKPLLDGTLASGEVIMGTGLCANDDSRADSTLVQYVVVPVLDNDKKTIGAFMAVINLMEDANISGKIMDDSGMYSVITAGDRVISSNLDSGLYRFSIGSQLPEDIRKAVLENGMPYIHSIGVYSTDINGKDAYNSAFRPIRDIKGNIIGSQGIIYYDSLVETTLSQVRDFTIIIVILLIAIFTIISWTYLRAQRILMSEKQFSSRLSRLKRLNELLRQAADEDEVYDILLNMLKKDSNINQVLIARKELNEPQLRIYKALDNEKLNKMKGMEVSEDSCWAAKGGSEFIHNGNDGDFSCGDYYSDSQSYICLPIILNGIVSGVIQVQSSRQDYFTPELVSELRMFVDAITPVISNLRLLESLNDMASIDPLTKLYNRRHLEKYMEEQIRFSKSNNLHMSIIMLDIDFFKKFNDTYGHEAGDYVLMVFADTLKYNVREGDLTARYGGEEFIVVLPHTDLRGAYTVAEKIREKVEKISLTAIDSENPPRITCSLGISCYPLHGNTIDKLIQSADKALYDAKNSGRNRTCVFGE